MREHRTYTLSLVFIIAILMSFAGCGGNSGDLTDAEEGVLAAVGKPAPVRGVSSYEGVYADELVLMREEDSAVGSVSMSDDGDYLLIACNVDEGWGITSVRCCVSSAKPKESTPGDFPYMRDPADGPGFVSRSTVDPGFEASTEVAAGLEVETTGAPGGLPPLVHFYSAVEENAAGQHTHTLQIPLEGTFSGMPLYVAASAEIVPGAGGSAVEVWARSDASAGSDWFSAYTVKPHLLLPDGPVTMSARVAYDWPGKWQTQFASMPLGCDLQSNRAYIGWCVDLYHYMSPGRSYSVNLYSSYDTDLPTHCRDNDWDMVNYIVNHKLGYVDDIQSAIWYFIGGGPYPVSYGARAMVEDALRYGEGYVPGPGETVVVVLDAGPDTQTTVVEPDPDIVII